MLKDTVEDVNCMCNPVYRCWSVRFSTERIMSPTWW